MTGVNFSTVDKIKGGFAMARPPFHSVGIFPFALGAVMARQALGYFPWALWGWGTFAVVLIMLSTYLAGEYFDRAEDALSHRDHPSRFAGGSGAIPAGVLPRWVPLAGSIGSLILAGAVGLIIQFGYHTGPWTIPLGIVGMIGGFFYSVPPLRWVSTGKGELWIALCYGWLPVTAAYYLPVGKFAPLLFWVSLPVAATIFNVILLNEYPDYRADMAAGKRNMLVRWGRERGAWLFSAVHLVGWLGIVGAVLAGVPMRMLWYYAPIFVISVGLVVAMLNGVYRDRAKLEVLCGLNILVNLGTTLAYILVFV